jgi:hypothetical protein
MVRLSFTEAATLKAWDGTGEDDNVLSFDLVSECSGVARTRVRRAVRSLARKGVLEFCRCSWNDEGQMCGAGYLPTDVGRAILADAA